MEEKPLIPLGPRRRSHLASRGREDWAYSKHSNDLRASCTEDASSLLRFPYCWTKPTTFMGFWRYWRQSTQSKTLELNVISRILSLSDKNSFPTSCIVHLQERNELSLELKVNTGKVDSIFAIDFLSSKDRFAFLSVIRGLNVYGCTASVLYAKIKPVYSFHLLQCSSGKSSDTESTEQPHEVSEKDFILWFLKSISSEQDVDEFKLRIESIVCETALKETVDMKRGSLFSNYILYSSEEEVCKWSLVTLVSPTSFLGKRNVVGELHLTTYRLSFVAYENEVISLQKCGEENEECKAALPSFRFGRRPDRVFLSIHLPLASISLLDDASVSAIHVVTMLGRHVWFHLDGLSTQTCVQVIREAMLVKFFTRTLSTHNNNVPLYNIDQEFSRQCSSFAARLDMVDNDMICSTYPQRILIPKETSLLPVSKFRSRQRFPAVTWMLNDQIWLGRSAQPCTGIKGNRCAEDEILVSNFKFVVDCRGPLAVIGNTLARGKGIEPIKAYPECTILFMGIANIHTMRYALNGIAEANEGDFALRMDEWLKHIALIWQGACRVAELLLLEKSSVLVHCSDGWDRTSQLVALCQLVCDPYFRTMKGFIVIVEKDFVSFGYQFASRSTGLKEQERSPVWVQFLECVWQFQRQFPAAFEFNSNFLLSLADAPYNGQYPTLAFDTWSQRNYNAPGCEDSLWDMLLKEEKFKNLGYQPADKVLWPCISRKRLMIWEAFHLKYDPDYFTL